MVAVHQIVRFFFSIYVSGDINNYTYLVSLFRALCEPKISIEISPGTSVFSQGCNVFIKKILLLHLAVHRSPPGFFWSSHLPPDRGCPTSDWFLQSTEWHALHMPVQSPSAHFEHLHHQLPTSSVTQLEFTYVVKLFYLRILFYL